MNLQQFAMKGNRLQNILFKFQFRGSQDYNWMIVEFLNTALSLEWTPSGS